MWGFITFGFAQVLSGIIVISLSGWMLSQPILPSELMVVFSIMVAVGVLSALMGMVIMSLGSKFRQAEMKVGRIILSVVLFSINVILAAAASFVIGITGSGVLLTISGVLIVVAVIIYIFPSSSARIVGSMFGFAAVFIMLAGGAAVPADVWRVVGLSGAFGSLLAMGTLYSVAFLIACVSALLYAILAEGKYERVAFLVLGIAATVYSIAIIINGLGPLTALPWEQMFRLDPTLSAFSAALIFALIVTSISGFLILATSGMSFAVYGREIFPTGPSRPPAARPGPVPAPRRFCRNCGNPIQRGEKFCGKCGSKVSAR